MARWQPDAVGRLQAAALELYADKGFDDTTVAEIAARAGLTERTYFRHFADKREVLFSGGEQLRDGLVDGVESAPADASPLGAVIAAIESIAPFFDERREHSTRRHQVIMSSPELQEREFVKRASYVRAVTEALRRRGVPAAPAELAAETGMTVFSFAYRRWADDPLEHPYVEHVRQTLAELDAVAASSGATAPA